MAVSAVLSLGVYFTWRRADAQARGLVKRIIHLPFRAKLMLAAALARDPRIPVRARLVPPALVLYLATPIDIIPDFIPVIGHLDDAVVLVVGVGLLLRFTPRDVLEEHISRFEPIDAAATPVALAPGSEEPPA